MIYHKNGDRHADKFIVNKKYDCQNKSENRRLFRGVKYVLC